MFAVHYMPDGHIDYIGEVAMCKDGFCRIKSVDFLSLLLIGEWALNGNEISFPAKECGFFDLKREALTELAERNLNHHIT